MLEDLPRLLEELEIRIAAAGDLRELEDTRVALIGKKGRVTELAKRLGQLDPAERPRAGQAINEFKRAIETSILQRRDQLAEAALEARLLAERVDVTLPSRSRPHGHIHPVSQVTDEIIAIFADMGFAVAEGPDVEDDFHNFTALNFPPEHPARAMHDTFFLRPDAQGEAPLLLRTHTSTVQIRHMMANKPPHRIIAPGRTYRCDSDATHTPMFHQVEGLVIDRRSHMGHLKGCLIDFLRTFFERDDVPVRFRPSFFPFTEPSAEVDIGCRRTRDELIIGEGDDWLEILGCGMVHPRVLEAVGLDPAEWQGFAFGMGIDRVAMLKYGIPDLRTFFDGDIGWLEHYGFAPLDLPTTYNGLSR
ncbi:MAG: phenylalanine--tRNA ligase subunit alpha [Geminicoccaceae bacterium]|nr:phenylalanine--tRNA ligase subunit alpha [Geminicoccaceae bacterium]